MHYMSTVKEGNSNCEFVFILTVTFLLVGRVGGQINSVAKLPPRFFSHPPPFYAKWFGIMITRIYQFHKFKQVLLIDFFRPFKNFDREKFPKGRK